MKNFRLVVLGLLLLCMGGTAHSAENLQLRRTEIRWRLAGLVAVGKIQPREVEVVEEMVVNEEYSVATIPAGTTVENWCTPRRGAKAREYRPGGRTYVTPHPVEVAVFDDERLSKRLTFMIGRKRCFNSVVWSPPVKKEPSPPPAPPVVDVPVRKDVVVRTHDGQPATLPPGASDNFQVEVDKEVEPNTWRTVDVLRFRGPETQTAEQLDRRYRYRFRELAARDWVVTSPPGGVYYLDARSEAPRTLVFINEYCLPPPLPPIETPPVVDVPVRKDVVVRTHDGQPATLPPGASDNFQVEVDQEVATETWKTVTVLRFNGAGTQTAEQLDKRYRYRFRELAARDWVVTSPPGGVYYFDARAEAPRTLVFINEYCLPPPPIETPPVVRRPIPEFFPPSPPAGYVLGNGYIERHERRGLNLGLIPIPGNLRERETVIIRRGRPPAQSPIVRPRPHPIRNKTPDDPADGNTPPPKRPDDH